MLQLKSNYDLVISGGSNLALLSALAFNQEFPDLSILVIEGGDFVDLIPGRSIAINRNNLIRLSKIIIAGRSLLQILSPYMQQIKSISVEQQQTSGVINFLAQDYNFKQFGAVIHLNDLNQQLLVQVDKIAAIQVVQGRLLTADYLADQQTRELTIQLAEQQCKLTSKLLVVASGQDHLAIDCQTQVSNSERWGMVAQVNLSDDSAVPTNAFEYFSQQGPIALLGQASTAATDQQKSFALVWCASQQQLQSLTQAQIIERLQAIIDQQQQPYRIVGLSAINLLPLITKYSQQLVFPQLALIGNAATQLHPVSGQGYNLGIDGVYCLIEALKQHNSANFANVTSLLNYQNNFNKIRSNSYLRTQFLSQIFTIDNSLVTNNRKLLFNLLASYPKLATSITKASLGFN